MATENFKSRLTSYQANKVTELAKNNKMAANMSEAASPVIVGLGLVNTENKQASTSKKPSIQDKDTDLAHARLVY